jgi:hypothetical protein
MRKLVRRIKDKLKQRAIDVGIGALIVGGVSSLFGVDLAPTEIDVIVTAGAALVTVFERWRATR